MYADTTGKPPCLVVILSDSTGAKRQSEWTLPRRDLARLVRELDIIGLFDIRSYDEERKAKMVYRGNKYIHVWIGQRRWEYSGSSSGCLILPKTDATKKEQMIYDSTAVLIGAITKNATYIRDLSDKELINSPIRKVWESTLMDPKGIHWQ